jgi:hypothetical protein
MSLRALRNVFLLLFIKIRVIIYFHIRSLTTSINVTFECFLNIWRSFKIFYLWIFNVSTSIYFYLISLFFSNIVKKCFSIMFQIILRIDKEFFAYQLLDWVEKHWRRSWTQIKLRRSYNFHFRFLCHDNTGFH